VDSAMTDKQFQAKLSEMVIIVDSREQQNLHITNIFDKKGIKYVKRKLDYGDYAFCTIGTDAIPKSYETKIVIERKFSLEELSSNFTTGRERFKREFDRAKEVNAKVILMIENGSYRKLLEHKYDTDLSVESFKGSIFSFKAKYGIEVEFIESSLSAFFIYNTFRYFLREDLKNMDRDSGD
jgi:ERCC4-type nuclease